MKAIVVYESYWGNTAMVARAIGEGIGPGTPVFDTTQATLEALSGADLLVVGAPVLGFSLPSELVRSGLDREKVPPQPDALIRPAVGVWLKKLPPRADQAGCSAAFETRIWWSPGGSVKAITRALEKAGYPALAEPGRFIVTGRYGPLRAGELERARAWGEDLIAKAARALGGGQAP